MAVNFDQITNQLYVGGRLDPGDWYVLAALNITVDINLQAEEQDRFTQAAPEVYLWLPTPDWYGPGIEALSVGTRFLHIMIRLGRKVYVHCNQGLGRAPTVAAGYLITMGMEVGEAMNMIRVQRPLFNPNKGQIRQLHEFAEMWREGRTNILDTPPLR